VAEHPTVGAWWRGDATVPKLGFRLLGIDERAGARGDSGGGGRVRWWEAMQWCGEGGGVLPEPRAAAGHWAGPNGLGDEGEGGAGSRVAQAADSKTKSRMRWAVAPVVCSPTTDQTQTLRKKGEKFRGRAAR
jgi:hypothetical protein